MMLESMNKNSYAFLLVRILLIFIRLAKIQTPTFKGLIFECSDRRENQCEIEARL